MSSVASAARKAGGLPPGPRGLFAKSNPLLSADWLASFSACGRDYGDVVFFCLLHVPVCLLFHPDHVEQVLVTEAANFTKSQDYRALARVLGDGLLTSEGDKWLAHRKLIQPAFHHEKILRYARLMSDLAAIEMNSWRDGEVRDLHRDMMRLTLRIVASALFGADVTGKENLIGSALGELMEQFAGMATWAFLLPGAIPIPMKQRLRSALRGLDEIIFSIIRARRGAEAGSADLLGILLAARSENGAGLNDRELRDEIMTLLLAGHETTANALAWTFYLLAQNPDVESALNSELQRVLAGRPPSAEDLPRLPFTEMVIKESMRLYPPAWGIGRRAKKSFDVGGYHLPARTNVFVLQWAVQHDARSFPQPDKFDPERWRNDPVRSGKLPRFSYFPFGGGPRVCVGAGFASMEAVLLLASIAQRFHFSLVPDHPVEPLPSVTLRPRHGIKVVLSARV